MKTTTNAIANTSDEGNSETCRIHTPPTTMQDAYAARRWLYFQIEVESKVQEIVDGFKAMPQFEVPHSKWSCVSRTPHKSKIPTDKIMMDWELLVAPLNIAKTVHHAPSETDSTSFAHAAVQPMQTETRKDSGIDMWQPSDLPSIESTQTDTSYSNNASNHSDLSTSVINERQSPAQKYNVRRTNEERSADEYGWATIQARAQVWSKKALTVCTGNASGECFSRTRSGEVHLFESFTYVVQR